MLTTKSSTEPQGLLEEQVEVVRVGNSQGLDGAVEEQQARVSVVAVAEVVCLGRPPTQEPQTQMAGKAGMPSEVYLRVVAEIRVVQVQAVLLVRMDP
jgi:hypothetical protein